MLRQDGRQASDLRELGLTTSLLSRADGSAKFSHGPVSVLASVAGPLEVRLRDELVDRATVEINIRPARGLPGPSTKAFSDSLSYILLPILLLHRHPRSLVQLSLQTLALPTTRFSKPFRTFTEVLGEDEAEEGRDDLLDPENAETEESVVEKAALINAAICALVDAAIGMEGMVCAVGVAILQSPPSGLGGDDGDDVAMQENGHTASVILDPMSEEERDASATFCVAFSFGQGAGGSQGDMCFLEMGRGSCDEAELMQAIDLARTACSSILSFIRKSHEARYSVK